MQTLLTRSPEEAARFIREGKLAAFPTETVYGLGADVLNADAVAKIFVAKKRPADNPLIVHIRFSEQIELLAESVTENARKFVDAFFPGPLTIVLKKTAAVPLIATAGLDTVAVRMPAGDLARQLLEFSGTPIAAPSANLSGRPSPTTWQSVLEDLDGRIDCILQGGPTSIGLESTVVECTSVIPTILRSGSVSLEQLRAIVPETQSYSSTTGDSRRSPGMLHRHYSPIAKVRLAEQEEEIEIRGPSGFIGLRPPAKEFVLVRKCESVEEYARSLFEFFRECDRAGVEVIYCETVSDDGIGRALMDRINRAAAR